MLAIALWLATAGVFLWVVAGTHPEPLPIDVVEGAAEESLYAFARLLLLYTRDERRRQAFWLKRAIAGVALALIVTFGAVASGVFVNASGPQRRAATVTLIADGRATLSRACGAAIPDALEGAVDPASLDQAFVDLELAAGACPRHAKFTHLRLARRAVAMVWL